MIFKDEISKRISTSYREIDIGYKRAVIAGIITCIIAYAFQLTHVVMSPDMYSEVVTGDTYSMSYSGRWFMAFIRNVVLFDRRIVPTFNLLISLSFFISSVLLVLKMWRINRPLFIYISIVIITANTYVCHILRWENAHLEASITTFIAVLAVYISGRGKGWFFLALLLMTCAHGGYQTGVSFSCAALFGGLAFWLYQEGNFNNFWLYVKSKLVPGLLTLGIGFLLHKIVLRFLLSVFEIESVVRLQNSHIPSSIDDLIHNLAIVFNSLLHIFTDQILYFNSAIVALYVIFATLLFVSLVCFLCEGISWSRFLLTGTITFFVLLTLLSVYLPSFVIGYEYVSNRILYPVAIFHALAILFVLSSRIILVRNIAVISSFALMFVFSWHNNLYAYRAFVQDRADFDLASRIISRIEGLPEYGVFEDQPLKLAIIGTKDIATPGYKFTSWPRELVRREGAFRQAWSAKGIFSYFHFRHKVFGEEYFENYEISQKMGSEILMMSEWPSSKSVAIIGDVAFVMLDKSWIPKSITRDIYEKNAVNGDSFSIPLNPAYIRPLHQISSLSLSGKLISIGNDPSISLTVPVPAKDRLYILRVGLLAPDHTNAQLFFKSDSDQGYSEDKSRICSISKDQGECYFVLEGNSYDGKLRLDPGYLPGEYQITDISLKDVTPMRDMVK